MMNKKKDRLDSIWKIDSQLEFNPLTQNRLTEVCVVGGGIAGLSTAYQLAKRGHEVTVVDSFTFGSGQTGRTTAHLTTQLEETFVQLLKMHGAKNTKLFHDAHRSAIDAIEQIVESGPINCDFKRLNGYLFRGNNFNDQDLLHEQEAAKKCNIKLDLISKTPLLDGDVSCLKFAEQAQFNPMKYLKGLLRVMGGPNVTLHENTHITGIRNRDSSSTILTTEDNFEILAKNVVIATDSPVSNHFAIHTKQHAYRTYAMAFRAQKNNDAVLLWDTEDPYHYVRFVDDNLVIGGEDHKTGHTPKGDPFAKLEQWSRDKFNFIQEVKWKWSGQVFEPADQLPYIGKAPGLENVYIITGASGIGMTTGTIASLMLPDLIDGGEHPWKKIFSPVRTPVGALKEYIKENVNVAFQYGSWITPSEAKTFDKIPDDSGQLMREGLSKTCVYHESGEVYEKKSAVCTHLGGIVHWNDIEKTWDCPCHGSRFNVHGKVIEGPAISGLSER
jgi:glycine/D-amino acid oxidase-like deaminating enzyme/nitrite reductase/ring-hydroxylating ferredoxin subunit